jgi:multiple sugar transport system permease protein
MNTSRRLPYLLLLPGIALLLATLYPFLSGVYWSFTDFDLTSGQNPAFSGLSNYLEAFGGGGVGLHALLITFAYAALAVVVQTLLGFGVALLLGRERFYTLSRSSGARWPQASCLPSSPSSSSRCSRCAT